MRPKGKVVVFLCYSLKIKSYLHNYRDQIPKEMNRNVENQKNFLLSTKLPSQNQEFSTHNQSTSPLRSQQHEKSRFVKQKQQILPEISSPFLKKTVYNMFSQKRLQQLKPFLFQETDQNVKHQRIQESKSMGEALKEHRFAGPKKEHSKAKQIVTTTKVFLDELLTPKKIPKIISQSKGNSNRTNSEYVDFKKSLGISQRLQNSSAQKLHKNNGNNPQGSQRYQQSFKSINSFSSLSPKDFIVISQAKQKVLEFQKTHGNQLKSNGFVLRQKLSKEIYQQQREQINLVKELVKNSKGLSLDKDIKVKKYAHFFPTIIHIQP